MPTMAAEHGKHALAGRPVYNAVKRVLDVLIAGAGLIALSPVLLGLALWVRLDSPGPSLHWSRRFGCGGALFAMPKFRTMRIETPDMATAELPDPQAWITPAGRILRRTSLDELPQLWSILTGAMSLVGPRPALHSQAKLMALRAETGAAQLRPGLTGWAQVKGRDALSLEEKSALEAEYVRRRGVWMDLRILAMTAAAVLRGE